MTNPLRIATKADLPGLMLLEQAAFPNDAWGEISLSAHLDSPITCTLLYEKDGVLEGALLLQLIHPEFEILRIATHPDMRRQGVARALLSHAHAHLKEKGFTKGFLEVRQSNTPAITLYRNAGYLQTGKRAGYYQHPTEDALLMEIAL